MIDHEMATPLKTLIYFITAIASILQSIANPNANIKQAINYCEMVQG